MFSIRLNGDGRCETLEEDISQSLRLILFTPKGTRIYQPEYGCDAMSYIDRPIWTLQQLIVDIAKQVAKYETRITLERVEPCINDMKISIKLAYTVKSISKTTNHVIMLEP